jgi:AAA domain, putative AbiEii toxin, Type IV TA system
MIDWTLRLDRERHELDTELSGEFQLEKVGELERVTFPGAYDSLWHPVFESNNEAFFAVAYGATRRVEAPETFDLASRTHYTFLRGQRLQGLFQESFSLVPLETWLPRMRRENRSRYDEVEGILNALLRPSRCVFTGVQERHADYLFEFGGSRVPSRWMSDGYRAFVGWAGDMLFHACLACPRYKRIVDLHGVIMVDDIDLQLHPRWQIKVVPTIARVFPRMQFILTSHSPLVAGSLEWMNIITLKRGGRSNSTHARRLAEGIHGLDADQVLISDFFGLKTTRAAEKASKLDRLTLKARGGDDDAARRLIAELAKGMEDPE